MNRKPLIQIVALTALLSALNHPLSTLGQGSAFTYQGRLNDSGGPVTGIYDLRFTLYDSSGGPTVVAGPLTSLATGVTNGLFTVALDFGNGPFSAGAARWLNIDVRTNGAGSFATLRPRQALTAAPYAITAGNLTGTLEGSSLLTNSVGTNQLSGYVNSRLALAGMGSSSIGKTNDTGYQTRLQNPTLRTDVATNSIIITNGAYVYGPGAGSATNDMLLAFTPTDQIEGIFFMGKDGDLDRTASFLYWPNHGAGMPEVVEGLCGGSKAIGYKWIQYGLYGTPMWTYYQEQPLNTLSGAGPTNLWDSVPILFSAGYWPSPGVQKNAGSVDDGFLPGIHFKAADTNGNGSLGIYSKFAVNFAAGGMPMTGNIRQHDFQIGPNPGFSFSGGLTNDGVGGITANYILPDGNVMTLQHGVATRIGPADPDAASFFLRAGITNGTAQASISQLVTTLKASGAWTNLHIFYPFTGANDAAHSINLVSNTFQITWHGAVTNDAHGLWGDGATAYGETGYDPGVMQSTNSAFYYVYQTKNAPGPSLAYGCFLGNGSGAANGTRGWTWIGSYPDNASVAYNGPFIRSNPTPYPDATLTPPHFLAMRTNYTDVWWYKLSSQWSHYTAVDGAAALDVATNKVTILASNGRGGSGVTDFSSGNLQTVAIGNGMSLAQAASLMTAVAAFNGARSGFGDSSVAGTGSVNANLINTGTIAFQRLPGMTTNYAMPGGGTLYITNGVIGGIGL